MVPLGQIAAVKLGKMLDRSKHKTGRELRYLRNINVRWGSIDTSDLLEMFFKDAAEEEKYSVRPGDVLVCEGGEPGRASVWAGGETELKYQKALHRVRFNEPYEPKLLVYFLERMASTGRLEEFFTGSTIKHFTRESFIGLRVPNPPLPEQRRIVARIEELFSRLDAGVAALRHAKAQLQRYRQSVLAAAVTGQLTCGNQVNWRSTCLNDLVTIKSGTGFPKHLQGEASGDYPFYKVGDISANWQQGRTSLTSADNYLNETEVRKIRGTILPADTTVFAKIGAAVALNRRGLLTRPSLVDNNVMALIPGEEIVPKYLFWFMCQVDLGVKTRGGAVPSLRKGDLAEVPMNLPSIAEQHQIVAEVEARTTAIDHLEAELDCQITRSNRLRQSTLAAAFAGHLT
jgi:restriction endonuclease S subunit